MKLTILFIAILMFSCNNKDEEAVQPESIRTEKIIAALISRDSTRPIKVLYRTIDVKPQYDSASKKWNVVIDTFWNQEISVPFKDSTGKDTFQFRYLRVPKDSVDWHVENRDVDSIMKKR